MPPTGVEQDQLEKFTDEKALEEEFEKLYLRFSDATAASIADIVARRPTPVLRFDVHPLVEIQQVLDAAGEPLFFVRAEAEGDEFEGNFTVVLPEPLVVGVPAKLSFVYVGDLVDTLWGRGECALKTPIGWYPSIGYLQRATYDLTFRVDKGDKIFASGERVSDEVVEGAPPITVFGTASGFGGDALGNVGADVGNSLVMFSQMFGDYPFTYMSATRIPYSHGQGFPGLLHLAAGSFGSEVPGHTEAFRGHETAHQWWGHIVGWKTYRDQWISEGFASYSGALYAEAYLHDPELLDKMTAAWRNDIFKRGNAGFRHFGMANGVAQRLSDGSMSGPVTLGGRLSSSETPADYSMLVYEKGAYIPAHAAHGDVRRERRLRRGVAGHDARFRRHPCRWRGHHGELSRHRREALR